MNVRSVIPPETTPLWDRDLPASLLAKLDSDDASEVPPVSEMPTAGLHATHQSFDVGTAIVPVDVHRQYAPPSPLTEASSPSVSHLWDAASPMAPQRAVGHALASAWYAGTGRPAVYATVPVGPLEVIPTYRMVLDEFPGWEVESQLVTSELWVYDRPVTLAIARLGLMLSFQSADTMAGMLTNPRLNVEDRHVRLALLDVWKSFEDTPLAEPADRPEWL